MIRDTAASPSTARPTPRSSLWPLWLVWVIFVVYGSLVPLDFQPRALDMAWQRLLQAPMLTLGIESRADWVANGVLYLPVGFLTTGALMGDRGGRVRRAIAGLLGLSFGCALAIVVECAQTAFPPRTVSRNDLLAEAIGTAVGMAGALVGAGRFHLLLAGYGQGGALLARRLARFYVLIFPAMALFPFDLLVSADEFHAKLGGPLVGLWLAESSHELGTARLSAKLAVETLVVLPLGAFWAAWRDTKTDQRQPRGRLGLLRSASIGALLGLLIEAGQFVMASGQCQGFSVLTRAAGFALGATAWQMRHAMNTEALKSRLRRISALLLAALVSLLVLFGGAWQGPWLAPEHALWRLQREIRFVPFYYHYFTTEMQAVISLTAVSLSYAPLGLLGWAWGSRRSAVAAAAALLAAAMEAAKLFAEGTHPDPTNIGIAAAAVWATQIVLERLFSAPRLGHAGALVGAASRVTPR